jgi:cullin 1
MKSRKRMKHTLLVTETIQMIKARFTPKVGDIKKCIDVLIEKEYLERLDADEMAYLA